MDRDLITKEMANFTINGSHLDDKTTINLINNLNNQYFEIFYDYRSKRIQEILNGKFEVGSYRSYRSSILYFFVYLGDNDINIEKFNQQSMDDYLKYLIDSLNTSDTYDNKTSHLKSLQDVLSVSNFNDINFSSIEYDKQYLKSPKKSLTSKEIEGIRHYFTNEENKDEDKYLKLFIFELMYRYEIQLKLMKNIYYKNFDKTNAKLKLDEKEISIDADIFNILEKIKDNRKFNKQKKDFRTSEFKQMKDDLNENRVISNKFRYKDIHETKIENFNRCPECGNSYENTSENWVLKQYYEDGKKWIVCKNCGEDKNEK